MSRNLRQKFPTASRKAVKRRGSDSSSSLNLSDEDGYSGVEDISDSEDEDEEDVDAAEEEHIKSRELHSGTPSSPRPQSEDDEDDDDVAEVEDDEEEENEEEEEEEADADDSASWDGIVSEVDESSVSDHHISKRSTVPAERHVRFVDVPSSDSDSTDTEDDHADFFPDIFVDQSTLDPAFRREIELDGDNDDSSNSGSFWDYSGTYNYDPAAESEVEAIIHELEEEETPVATPRPSQDDRNGPSTPTPPYDEPQDLDGYETDGDTTEEDIPEPPVRRKLRRPEPTGESSGSDTDQPVKARRGQPRVGRFNLDSSERKPIAVVNPISRKMMIFTPHRRRQLDLSPEQFNLQYFAQMEEQSSPMLSNSAQIMMSAMFSSNTFGDYLNTQAMGPAEAFFPFTSEANTADEISDIGAEADEDEAERHLDISDFITWDGGYSSADDEDDGADWGDGDELASTPARPTTASSELSSSMAHINADTVGAFRRDQINQKLILSSKATQDSLALSSPYNYSTLRGLKSDRFETAAVPLTPLRRQKKQMHDLSRSPLESMSQKRKASSEHGLGHKRHRSISDVNLLRI